MKECKTCHQTLPEPESYRKSPEKEKIVEKSNFWKFAKYKKLVFDNKLIKLLINFVLGCLVFACVAGVLWLVIPGVYYLGCFLNNNIMHWNIACNNLSTNSNSTDNDPFVGWFIGLGSLLSLGIPYVVYLVGREVNIEWARTK